MRRCQSIPLSYRDCECWLPGNLRDRAFDARRRGHGCFRQKSLDRNPEENPVYGIVSEHLESFLARQRERDRPVPQFVERELRPFLDCGVLANGFLRVHCNVCRNDRVVPFSCKGRVGMLLPLRPPEEDPMRDQPTGDYKEDPRLPWIAVEAPAWPWPAANLPCSSRGPFQFLSYIPILQRAQAE
jgi:hypothetical protein